MAGELLRVKVAREAGNEPQHVNVHRKIERHPRNLEMVEGNRNDIVDCNGRRKVKIACISVMDINMVKRNERYLVWGLAVFRLERRLRAW